MKRHSKGQLHLDLRSDDTDVWMSCKGIFSLNYLRQRVMQAKDIVPSAEQARSSYETIKALWFDNREGLVRRDERYTRQEFLEPVLRDLGWSLIPDASLPFGQFTKKRPDYCLFGDEAVQKEAATQTEAAAVYCRASTVLEAKQVNHPLHRISSRETPGWFPSQQVQDYLRNAKDKHGNRFFNWAILTNGMEWRLYCEHAGTDAYFAFHLTHGEDFCTLDDFRLFLAIFRPHAFDQQPGTRCLLDDFRQESVHRQVELEMRMRKRILDVLEDLANGFRAKKRNGITPANYADLYNTSLIFLYRLLFILYAESRGLLPADPSKPGANKVYRDKFSLSNLVDRLRAKTEFQDDAFDDLYERLLKLFHLINGDSPEHNKACGVTRYNGGLFDPDLHRLIEKWRVGDKTLADVLRQLVFSLPPARSVSRQQQISTDEAIDYSTLEVRQLGDIYEGLLGAHLEDERGRLVLKNEKGKNH